MVLALMYHVIGKPRDGQPDAVYDRTMFPVYVIGGLIFVFAFLDAGRDSVPRRMATHLQAWLFTDQVGSIGAILVVLAMLYFAIRITAGLLKTPAGTSIATDGLLTMPAGANVDTTDAAG
jgi:cytochrome c oxidase subunit 1